MTATILALDCATRTGWALGCPAQVDCCGGAKHSERDPAQHPVSQTPELRLGIHATPFASAGNPCVHSIVAILEG